MATLVTKLVKYSGGDYTTIQGALDAIPSNLVTADEQWDIVIDESADGVFLWSLTQGLSLTSRTTDSTRYVRIKAASGKSFGDHADKLTNALRWNGSNGIAITSDHGFSSVLNIEAPYTRVEGLQLKSDTGSDSSSGYSAMAVSANNITVRNCILALRPTLTINGQATIYWGDSDDCKLINCVVSAPCGVFFDSSSATNPEIRNCTFVYTGGSSSTRVAFNNSAVSLTALNCAVMGFADGVLGGSVTLNSSSNYNATSSSAPSNWGANSLNGLTAADQIESTTSSTLDARAKASGSLDGAGTRDQTNTSDLDIIGQSRSTTAPTIGAWESITVAYAYARPASDITEQWSLSAGTDSWDLLNESTYSDSDYIYATAAAQTTEVKLAAMSTPETGTSLLVNYRVQGVAAGGTVTVSLYCGATLIKADTARTANGDYTLTVASTDWDTEVTDWTDMRLRFVSG